MHLESLLPLLRCAAAFITTVLLSYATLLVLLTIPALQNQAIYLNKITLTWGKDVSEPGQWGFLPNQVTPFFLHTANGEKLHAWHILPLGVYVQNEDALTREPAGAANDIKERLCFRLLRNDPNSLLVLYFHGAAGTLGSGWRPPSYRAMSAAMPERIHVIAIDYRGFGSSTGSPSEEGLMLDATALADFALNTLGIPASRIVLFGQSLGTAVAIALAHRNASESTLFAGMVLVAPFADVESLTATYRLGGVIPLLGPLARFPGLLALLNSFSRDKWATKSRLAEFVRRAQAYHVSIIHAEDDYDIPWTHSEVVFWHAVGATGASTEVERQGQAMEYRTDAGLVRLEVTKYGLHDMIMSYPVVSRAVARAFRSQL